jgi:SAM-dependent methyltransferase
VDKAPAAIATARARLQAHSIGNVSFREGDPAELMFDQPFDAIVGRYVLQFCAAPAATLRRLAAHLRPGGVMVFHELDWEGVRSYPPAPIYDQCCQWFIETFRLLGTETRMGIKLHSAFVEAELRPPSMRMDAIIGAGSEVSEWLQALADLVRTMLPEVERLGVATAAEVDIETLADRLLRENAIHNSVVVGRTEVCAWSRA